VIVFLSSWIYLSLLALFDGNALDLVLGGTVGACFSLLSRFSFFALSLDFGLNPLLG